MRLSTVTLVEAASAVVARHAALSTGTDLGQRLEGIERAWAGRTPSDATRATSRLMARGLVRLSARLWPRSAAIGAVAQLAHPPRPIVLGAIAAECGLSGTRLAYLIGYDDVQTVTSAALKLQPLDPAQTTAWVMDLLPHVHAMAAQVSDLADPDAMPAPSAPLIEQWAQAHARTSRRLFSA
jgi:urease accessory protein